MSVAEQMLLTMKESVRQARVPIRIFTDPDIYELEQKRLFGRCWNFLAHESELAQPGDYVLRYIGNNNIILARDEAGVLHGHINMCRHRGNQVCKAEMGNSSHFRCSYHGWTYNSKGELVGVPYWREAYKGRIDRAEWGLQPVRIENYHGLIFGNLDLAAPPLLDYLGGYEFFLDFILKPTPAGTEFAGPPIRWVSETNWKCMIDNFSGDGYHTPVTHGFGFQLGYYPSTASKHFVGQAVHIPGRGHAMSLGKTMGNPPFFGWPENIREGFKQGLPPAQYDALKDTRVFVGVLFPNLGILIQPFSRIPGDLGVRFATLRVFRPVSPTRTEFWSWCLLPKDAPQEYKEEAYRSYALAFGPAGLFEQDDTENWTNVTEQMAGTVARELYFPYDMGIEEERDENWPGPGVAINPYMTDANMRNVWRSYADIMLAEDGLPNVRNGHGNGVAKTEVAG